MICRLLSIAVIVAGSVVHNAHASVEADPPKDVTQAQAPASPPDVHVHQEPDSLWGLAIKYGLPALIVLIGTIAGGILVKNKVMKKPASGAKTKADIDLLK